MDPDPALEQKPDQNPYPAKTGFGSVRKVVTDTDTTINKQNDQNTLFYTIFDPAVCFDCIRHPDPTQISDTRIRLKYPRTYPDPQQCMLGFTFMFYCLVKEPSFTIIFVLVVISCRPGVATEQGGAIWLSGNMSYVTSSKDVSIWSRLRRFWFQVSRCYGPGQNLVIGWCFIPYRLKTLRKRLFFILNNFSYFKIILDLFTYSKLF